VGVSPSCAFIVLETYFGHKYAQFYYIGTFL
jgi:hypothetical protein